MMKKYFVKILFLTVLFGFSGLLFSHTARAGQLSDYAITCGTGEKCDLGQKKCLECQYFDSHGVLGANRDYWSEYHCVEKHVNSMPAKTIAPDTEPDEKAGGCRETMRGGLKGTHKTGSWWGAHKETVDAGRNCIVENLQEQYAHVCYGCIMVVHLISGFTKAGASAYEVSRSLANVILVIGTILWLAAYVLKNISSFTTAEPMKMLHDIFIMLFKVLCALVIVNAGIRPIMQYSLTPIIVTGTDFSDAITTSINKDFENAGKSKPMSDEELKDRLTFYFSQFKIFGDDFVSNIEGIVLQGIRNYYNIPYPEENK